MLDRQFIRANPDLIKAGAAKKHIDVASMVDEWVSADAAWRRLTTDLETKKAEMNRISKSIGMLMGQGKKEEAEAAKGETSQLKAAIGADEDQQRELEARLRELELSLPNVPHESVPEGRDEYANVERRAWGEKPQFAQAPKPHWEIAEKLMMLDMPRGAKISGSGFALYTGWGARLQRALFNFMADHQTTNNGYREMYPPYIVNAASLYGTGQLPKFADDLYKIEGEDLYLIPTAEVPVTNIYRDEILDNDMLTLRMAAYSGCFRKEAGAAGKDTRGLIRMHQFDKVELVKLTRPEDSMAELESLVIDAESVLQTLGLHYRVMEMCGGELSFSNAKQYDLELWSPGVDKYLEISSCSNFTDFQARRANIRFRRAQGEKPEFVHTLNGSGLATPRLFSALVETYQQPDGSVVIPGPLRSYVGTDRISAD